MKFFLKTSSWVGFLVFQSLLMAQSPDSSVSTVPVTEVLPVESTAVPQKEDPTDPIPQVVDKLDAFNLTQYKPLYAIYGNPSTKTQLSFKYQLTRKQPLYVAYTQLMFWNLQESSNPFRDINFNPEILYRWSFNDVEFFESLDLIPFGHKSNGRAGLDSRSVNYSALQLNMRKDLSNWSLRGSFRLRTYYNLDPKTNPDFRHYEGPFEINFSVARYGYEFFDKIELAGRVYTGGRWGSNWELGGKELSLIFRVLGFDITPSFYVQYFYGYTESMLIYDEKQNQIRVGLML